MSWGNYKKRAQESGGGGGKFVRMKGDGDTCNVVVLGTPMERWSRWTGSTYETCEPDDDGCRTSYIMNVWDLDNSAMRLLELNSPTFVDLADAMDEEDDPENTHIRIKRNGTGTSTRYSIRPRGLVSAGLQKVLTGEKEELDDLTEFGGHTIKEPPAPLAPDEDVPF